MLDMQESEICTLLEAVQDLPTPQQEDAPFDLDAPWTQHITEEELQRLSKLHNWIKRKKQSLENLQSEVAQIRSRNIKRMRRASGKN